MKEDVGSIHQVICPKCGSSSCFPTHIGVGAMCVPCGHEFNLDGSMELYQIANPWLRRSIVLLLTVPFTIPIVIYSAVRGAWSEGRREWGDCVWSIKRAWRGK